MGGREKWGEPNVTTQRIYNRDVCLILAGSFFYMASSMLVTPLITGFAGSLGAGSALMGLVGGMSNFCSLICRPTAGNLADRLSKRRLSTVGLLLMLAGYLGYVFAHNNGVVMLARVAQGAGFACCSVCMSTWVSDLMPRDKVGSGMGMYGTMNALSMAVGPAIGVQCWQRLGYHVSFAVSALFAVGALVTVRLVSDRGMPGAAPAPRRPEPGEEHLHLLDRNVIPVAAIVMLFGIPYFATQSFLVTYVQTRQLPVAVSLFFPLYAGVLLVLRLSMRDLFDRLPYLNFVLDGAVCESLALVCMTFLPNNGVLFLAAALMAGGYGLMCSVSQSAAILMAGEGHRGLANSTYYVGLDLGMTLGPVLGGVLLGHLAPVWLYPVMLVTMPLSVAVYFMGGVGKKLRR